MSIESGLSIDLGASRSGAQRQSSFFFFMAIAFAVIAFGGFARTYFIPVASGAFQGPALVHLHGLLFFAWMILWVVQTRLASSGRRDLHRALGLAAVSVATAMVITTVALLVRRLNIDVATGVAPGTRALLVLPFTQISMFAAFFAVGVANLRRPDVHKRAMLLATANLLSAPSARLLAALVAPALTSVQAASIDVRFLVGLGGALVPVLLIGVAMLHDWRTRGRVHRTYVIGGVCIVMVQLLRLPFAQTELWRWITDGLLAFAS